jgi:hypothetical protein
MAESAAILRPNLFRGGSSAAGVGLSLVLGATLGFALLVGGLVLVVFSWAPTATRLPSVEVDRTGQGFALRFLPPERSGKKKLRSETFRLAKDIHAYLKAQPSSSAQSIAEHQQFVQATQGASEAETNARWQEYTAKSVERSERERLELAQRFGGRLQYLFAEYQRRGMLTDRDVSRMEWEAGSSHWIAGSASRLEGLAHRL